MPAYSKHQKQSGDIVKSLYAYVRYVNGKRHADHLWIHVTVVVCEWKHSCWSLRAATTVMAGDSQEVDGPRIVAGNPMVGQNVSNGSTSVEGGVQHEFASDI
ncbi:hypothetical protein Tco_0020035 [Tanacetum coccineum]